MKRSALLLVLLPFMASAQVHKCLGPDGKTMVLTDKPCAPAAAVGVVQVPLSTTQSPEHRALAAAESQDRIAADRYQALQLMITNGKIDEARVYARSPEEIELVRRVEAAQAKPKRRPATVCTTSGYAQGNSTSVGRNTWANGTYSGTTVCR